MYGEWKDHGEEFPPMEMLQQQYEKYQEGAQKPCSLRKEDLHLRDGVHSKRDET